MAYRVYYLDLAALLVCAVLLLSLCFRKMYRGKTNRIFFVFIVLIMLTTVVDILRTAPLDWIEPYNNNIVFRDIASGTYSFLYSMIYPVYIYMVGSITGTFKKIRSSLVLSVMYFSPLLINLMLLISNGSTHALFYHTLSPDGIPVYHRGFLIGISVAMGFYYAIFCLALIIYCRVKRRIETVKFLALLFIYPVNLLAYYIQATNPKLLVQLFGMALTVLLLSFFVLSIEENYDLETGAKPYAAFKHMLGTMYATGDNTFIVFAKIRSNRPLENSLGREVYSELMHQVCDRIFSVLQKENRPLADLYYLKNGLFAIADKGGVDKDRVSNIVNNNIPIIRDEYNLDGLRMKLDFAVCGVELPEECDNEEELIKFAETFVNYLPPNVFVRYCDIVPDREFVISNTIDRIVADAIKNDKFEVFYQPIYSVKDSAFTSAEALLRLRDETLGYVPPSIFIPAAEKSGAILQIGEFVIRDVCRFLAESDALDKGIKFVEVNLSVMQCTQKDMAKKIREILEEYKIEPERINFEITETASDYLADAVIKTMSDISENGNSFSLDDYGSGYSNLGRIMNFPYKIIKLDKCLIDGLVDDRRKNIMKETISLLKSLGAEIVVEGVEDKDKAEWFIEMECEYIQGYYYAKPMPEASFLSFLDENNSRDKAKNIVSE